ncbi:MAG: antitoxin MazE family protein [Alphaproteobacteria bacterium]|jgi:hypothetical protein
MSDTASRKQRQRDKVQSYRERMRARGLRPVQIWVPDTRTRAFAEAAHRQAKAVAESAQAQEDQAFIDALGDESGT